MNEHPEQQNTAGNQVSQGKSAERHKWSQKRTIADTVVGVIVFGLLLSLIFGSAYYFFFRPAAATVVIELPSDSQDLSARVLYNGVPVENGTLQFYFEDVRNKCFLTSIIASNSGLGEFVVHNVGSFVTNRQNQIRIDANYLGHVKSDATSGLIRGQATLYSNWTPPFSEASLVIVGTCTSTVFGLLLFLFTGYLTRLKATLLFMVTYGITVLALVIPLIIVSVAAQNAYLVQMFESSPVGLLKAKTKNLSDAQWVFNIGGTVTPGENGESGNTSAGTPMPSSTFKTITGGVVIPFYVVLLAIFGAGINMTRRLPEIQAAASDLSNEIPTWKELLGYTTERTEKGHMASVKIRKEIIQNYMYLLSAPFLAIAVYYLLQIVATNVAEPVLVIMAFATGLISDAVVQQIVSFGESWLAQAKTRIATARTQQPETSTAKMQKVKSDLATNT